MLCLSLCPENFLGEPGREGKANPSMVVIPVLRRDRQEDLEFEASFSYTARPESTKTGEVDQNSVPTTTKLGKPDVVASQMWWLMLVTLVLRMQRQQIPGACWSASLCESQNYMLSFNYCA